MTIKKHKKIPAVLLSFSCKKNGILAFLLFLFVHIQAQDIRPPRLGGIVKVTYLVSDYGLAQSYYGDFLGFDKAFSYDSPRGKVVSYKVNDRQFLEFIEDKQARLKDRFLGVTFETANAEEMRCFLRDKGIEVPHEITVDGAGNKIFEVKDPAGVPIQFMEWGNNSLHRASKGKFLSDRRISKRIHHVGLYSEKMEDNPHFYTDVLGFKLFLRVPENRQQSPEIIYFQIPGTAEFVEHYPTDTRDFSHPCFVAEDMQEVMNTLHERRKTETLGDPMVGKGRRWLLNLATADGTRVEFTEMFLAK